MTLVSSPSRQHLLTLLEQRQQALHTAWVAEQLGAYGRSGAIAQGDLRAQSAEFLSVLRTGLATDGALDLRAPAWSQAREFLASFSRSCALQGFTPSETALFVFSLKGPVFENLRELAGGDARRLADDVMFANQTLDQLGLFTTEVYQKGREEVIQRQQEDMLELSTPVVILWDGILALPMIGTLDSSRAQVVMESLLQRIVETAADVAILDITGVPTVDTLTAQHLLKTVTAARLMGAECIISGIRPQIAQTIVHLGVDLGDVVTKATLADAFRVALQRRGLTVGRAVAAA